MIYLFILIAYVSGSVPYGLLLGKFLEGVDVRTIGSGNIGTTNVLRTGNKPLAAATLLCDFLKGFLPVYVAASFGIEGLPLLGIAYTAILGHIFPIWLKFQGGKGVATALGAFLGLSFPLGLFSISVWLLLAWFGNISSLSALGSFFLTPLFALFVLPLPLAVFCLGVGLLIFWTHRSNIRRLMTGEETGIGEDQNL